MNIPIPEGQYIKKIDVNEKDLEVEFSDRKKIALIFISLNSNYWPYLSQVIKDCRQNFMPQHKVDYFAWTDFTPTAKDKQLELLKPLLTLDPTVASNQALANLVPILRLYEYFYPNDIRTVVEKLQQKGLTLKREGAKFWLESTHLPVTEDVQDIISSIETLVTLAYADIETTLKGVKLIETEPVEWPAPTLMRYHLFLNEGEALKEYDYIFYLDADMRVVSKISDEILTDGLLAAEHPMYSLRKQYVPPYEPNKDSTAYIKRPGRVIDENGKPRFQPYYYAGGFQGGKADLFLKAMRVMKKNIDKDFDNNYTAIWNDESHWNKYLSDYDGFLTVLPPSYVYPDSLVKEYYEPIWGKSYEPKIITLTKPFSLSAEGANEINKFINKQ